MQTAAELGSFHSFNESPEEMLAEFYKRDSSGNIDAIFDQISKNAPDTKQAEAKLYEAQANLHQAELNLSYCDVVADIDGVVTRRNVNPGDQVIAGQGLMALRSLTDIWVDANFKETQLANLRIGQPVDLDVDMYGSHRHFQGRVSGFTMGTGSTLALLPAENATGNFVKVVQRLPVRIELTNYDPDVAPLFIGLSVTPYVYISRDAYRSERRQDASSLSTRDRSRFCTRPSMSAAALQVPLARRSVNPWLIAFAVVIPTFMEVLDTTIANVVLALYCWRFVGCQCR